MEFDLRKPGALSTIRMRAYSMIQNIQRKKTGSSSWDLSSAARPLVVVHCYRNSESMVRIISARKATKKEVRFYEERI